MHLSKKNMSRMLVILNQILAFILPAQMSLPTWACSCQIKPWLIVDLYRFNSIIFWSEPLLQIFWFENCNSFVFKLWSYPDYIYNPMPLHSFFFWLSIDTHIRSFMDRYILGWIIIRQCPSYSLNLWVLPWHIMPLVNSIICFCQPCSAFELVYFNPEISGICS